MKTLILLSAAFLLLSACAPVEEAYYIDREFAKASQAAWDAQIINKENTHADKVPEGIAGITAEEVMGVHNRTFAKQPKESKAFEFNMGNE
ncbi:MAG: hypothetical protein WCY68_02595 [Desulfuromonadales bacterium]